jgi:hypothetical protein
MLEGIECSHQVESDHRPRGLEEACIEPIRPRFLVRGEQPNGVPHFLLYEVVHQSVTCGRSKASRLIALSCSGDVPNTLARKSHSVDALASSNTKS